MALVLVSDIVKSISSHVDVRRLRYSYIVAADCLQHNVICFVPFAYGIVVRSHSSMLKVRLIMTPCGVPFSDT